MRPLNCFSACILLLAHSMCFAVNIHTTKFTDTLDNVCDSDCSLREAVQLANILPGPDTIFLEEGFYLLDRPTTEEDDEGEFIDEDLNVNGDLDVSGDLIIKGPAGGITVIDGNDNDRVLENILGLTELENITVTNGFTRDFGGGIENHDKLTLRYSKITANRAGGMFRPGEAGGIASYGALKIYSSEITDNDANSGEMGLGRGGGIFSTGELLIRDSLISGNSAGNDSDDGIGGGVYSSGNADVRRTLFTENWNAGSGSAIATVNGGILKMTHCTVSGNSAGYWSQGGAVANGAVNQATAGKLFLTNVTITNNAFLGLLVEGPTYIKNSIIVGNYNPEEEQYQNCRRIGGYINHVGLLMNNEGANCFGDIGFNESQTFITLLEPLADNGGPSLTHALESGSVAVDAGATPCPSHDQRGMPGNQDGNNDGISSCDLGAYERQN